MLVQIDYFQLIIEGQFGRFYKDHWKTFTVSNLQKQRQREIDGPSEDDQRLIHSDYSQWNHNQLLI